MILDNVRAETRSQSCAVRGGLLARQELELGRDRALVERDRQMVQAEHPQPDEVVHFLCCSTCGMSLYPAALHDGHLDRCYVCNAVWFDDRGLEQMAKLGPGLLQQIDDRFPAVT
jgi:hypothetical protein